MATRVKQRTGLKANLPTSNNVAGELLITTDQGTLHYAVDANSTAAIMPAIEDLSAIPAINLTEDLLLISDTSESGSRKAKKVTIANFKAALNIPAGSSDEKVAAVAGGTSGYIFGTDGTDGIIRTDASLTLTKDASNGFVTLSVGTIDCGTF